MHHAVQPPQLLLISCGGLLWWLVSFWSLEVSVVNVLQTSDTDGSKSDRDLTTVHRVHTDLLICLINFYHVNWPSSQNVRARCLCLGFKVIAWLTIKKQEPRKTVNKNIITIFFGNCYDSDKLKTEKMKNCFKIWSLKRGNCYEKINFALYDLGGVRSIIFNEFT